MSANLVRLPRIEYAGWPLEDQEWEEWMNDMKIVPDYTARWLGADIHEALFFFSSRARDEELLNSIAMLWCTNPSTFITSKLQHQSLSPVVLKQDGMADTLGLRTVIDGQCCWVRKTLPQNVYLAPRSSGGVRSEWKWSRLRERKKKRSSSCSNLKINVREVGASPLVSKSVVHTQIF